MKRLMQLLFALLVTGNVFSADIHTFNRLDGSAIFGAGLFHVDQDYASIQEGDFVDVKGHSYIRIGFDERLEMDYVNDEKEIVVHLNIQPFDNDNHALTAITTSLTLWYNPFDLWTMVDISDYNMEGVHKLGVSVISIEINGTTLTTASDIPDFMYIEAGFRAERYYLLDTETAPSLNVRFIKYNNDGTEDIAFCSGSTMCAGIDEFYVNWSAIAGAELYELEWTWIDNYSAGSYASTTSQGSISLSEFDFAHNSTRIRTSNNFYRIPQVFSKGYLVLQVRAIGRWMDNPAKELPGKYSSYTEENKVLLSDWLDIVTVIEEHEQDKNWQYQATYAEEGKKKEVVQYFDGSQRGRQSVTRINTRNQSVVGESIYDNEGRAAIQILPVPQENPALKYYESFNTSHSSSGALPYSDINFDIEASITETCIAGGGEKLFASDGAGQYYSTAGHTGDEDWQEFVPDAKGYPYTQVEYTPDNTGRIRNQSGVGIDHMIGGGHESRYFYSEPTQEELNRLFGYKVGYAYRYKKQMVVDANGQVSISYFDPAGKVIATSLSGETPDNLVVLDGSPEPATLETDLLQKVTDVDHPDDANELRSSGRFGANQDVLQVSAQIPVTVSEETHELEYSALPVYYSVRCNTDEDAELEEVHTFPFIYDVRLYIEDDCGNDLLDITDNLTTTANTIWDYENLELDLKQGTYTFTKELRVNEVALEGYKEWMLSEENPCLNRSFEPVIQGCEEMTFHCMGCFEELGTLEDFITEQISYHTGLITDPLIAGFESLYNQEYEECQSLCKITTSCDVIRQMMLEDMKPAGQYGVGAVGYENPEDELNIYHASANFLKEGNWRDVIYHDESGFPASVKVYFDGTNYTPDVDTDNPPGDEPGFYYVQPHLLVNTEDFISAFKPEWAEDLLVYHPEYELLSYMSEICSEKFTVSTQAYTMDGETEVSEGLQNLSISSEEFNTLVLEQVNTFAQANNGSRFRLDGSELIYAFDFIDDPDVGASDIKDSDPFFNLTYDIHDDLILSTGIKNSLMNAAQSDYEGSGYSMFEYAAKTVLAPHDPAYTLPVGWSDIADPDQKDQVWLLYRSYYLSTKAKINQYLMDMYGFSNLGSSNYTIFNGGIGSGGFSLGIVMELADKYPGFALDLLANTFSNFNGENLADTKLCDARFEHKVARVVRIDNLYRSDILPEDEMHESQAIANFKQWEETGLCPQVTDLQRLLNELCVSGTTGLTDSYSSETALNFTQGLMDAIDFGSTEITMDGAVTSNTLVLTFTGSLVAYTLTLGDVDQEYLSGAFDWDDYENTGSGSNNWHIYEVRRIFPVSSTTFELLVLAGTSEETALEFVIPVTASDNSLENSCKELLKDPACRNEEQIEHDLTALMNTLKNDGLLYSSSGSGYSLSSYDAYTESSLEDYFGSGSPKWLFGTSFPFTSTNYFKLSTTTHELYFVAESGVDFTDILVVNYVNLDFNSPDGSINCVQDDEGDEISSHLAFGLNQPLDIGAATEDPARQPRPLQLDLGCSCTAVSGNDHILPENNPNEGCCQTWPVQPESCNDQFKHYIDTYTTQMGYNPYYDPTVTEEALHVSTLHAPEDEARFCEAGYAYIVDEYLYYLEALEIDAASLPNALFITLSEFGNTVLGFDNPYYVSTTYHNRIMEAVDAYDLYVNGLGSNDVAQDWHDYVREHYSGLCPGPQLPAILPDIELEKDCFEWTNHVAQANANTQQSIYKGQVMQNFISDYIKQAMSTVVETLVERRPDSEFHYTLFNYDRAGNLIRTIPPKGVERFDAGDSDILSHAEINAMRTDPAEHDAYALLDGTTNLVPPHKMETAYTYNSLNQLVSQVTPDGGESRFAYDLLGRLVLSQNALQISQNPEQFSYTKYDDLGRVTEVGELSVNGYDINAEGKLVLTSNPNVLFNANYYTFPDNLSTSREEVSRTIYDELGGQEARIRPSDTRTIRELFGAGYAADNTRNRIVGIIYQEAYNSDWNIYDNATFYDYDVHGNVKRLMQVRQDEGLVELEQTIRLIDYSYDLVSGNVQQVTYQKGRADQFIHRYTYDEDNRITIVETSGDGSVFEKDAKYFYYDHGPLARTEIGDKKVQAMDYAYTIQGWIKTMNGDVLDEDLDMGNDGKTSHLNAFAGRDAMGYSLSYFTNDYASANTGMLAYSSLHTSDLGSSLYNGNIRSMHAAMSKLDESAEQVHRTVYSYDQLQRIKSMMGYFFDGSNDLFASNYESNYAFDPNGNLESMVRKVNSGGSQVTMDNFTYNYPDELVNNRLGHLDDAVSSGTFSVDVDDQEENNYIYDAIGQLTADEAAGITGIQWNVKNKVTLITKDDNSKIEFKYDALGNRISKEVYPDGSDPTVMDATHYVPDAGGNIMGTYTMRIRPDLEEEVRYDIKLTEQHIYGSSRLGLQSANLGLTAQVYADESLRAQEYDLDELEEGTYCEEAGTWLFDNPHTTGSFGGDPGTDLRVEEDADLFFAAHFTANTQAGEQYTLSFDVVATQAETQLGVYVVNCPGGEYMETNFVNSPGSYRVTFIAPESEMIRIKWTGVNDGGVSGQYFTLSNISLTGPGSVYDNPNTTFSYTTKEIENTTGDKYYELSNHLGNVLNVVTDRKLPVDAGSDDDVDYYTADVISYSDYDPYGMQLFGRHGQDESYRFGYNGMEADNEVKGEGNSYTTEFRQYDPRIGRWLSPDPLAAQAPGWNPYRFAFNNPIIYTDEDGLYETKREARQARRGAMDAGYKTGKIQGKKGDYYFQGTNKNDKEATVHAFKTKEFDIKPGQYKGGIEFYDAAEARGAIPPAQAHVQEAFKIGGYTVVPNYIDGKLDHYTTSIKVTDPTTFEETYRYDYIIGRDKLDHFEENIQWYGGGANLAFGANLHLEQWQIDQVNENHGDAVLGLLGSEWSDPNNLVDFAGGGVDLIEIPRVKTGKSKITVTKSNNVTRTPAQQKAIRKQAKKIVRQSRRK
ncbi:MAG: RHS repeat-associated core domain-containing protein [Bacteroidota bacterium]